MGYINKCAEAFKKLIETTTYTYHVSLNKKIRVFSIDFDKKDFRHAIGLQYLNDIDVPKSPAKTLDWILNEKTPVTDEFLSKSKYYKGTANDEKDIELRIKEFSYIEEYLDDNNIVYIYSPKDAPANNSLISCDYIIESYSKARKTTVYIFLKHRNDKDSNCAIVSFCVKKNTSYGGLYCYVMLKDKIENGTKRNLFRHNRYTDEQILENEPDYKSD